MKRHGWQRPKILENKLSVLKLIWGLELKLRNNILCQIYFYHTLENLSNIFILNNNILTLLISKIL
jgi:hypothetical protein